MRRLKVKARPSVYVFEDLSPLDFIQTGDYVFVDIMTVSDARSYCLRFPNSIVVESCDFFDFLYTHNVNFRCL